MASRSCSSEKARVPGTCGGFGSTGRVHRRLSNSPAATRNIRQPRPRETASFSRDTTGICISTASRRGSRSSGSRRPHPSKAIPIFRRTAAILRFSQADLAKLQSGWPRPTDPSRVSSRLIEGDGKDRPDGHRTAARSRSTYSIPTDTSTSGLFPRKAARHGGSRSRRAIRPWRHGLATGSGSTSLRRVRADATSGACPQPADRRSNSREPAPGFSPMRPLTERVCCISRKSATRRFMVMPLKGAGPPRRLIECVRHGSFIPVGTTIFYAGCEPGTTPSLHSIDLLNGRDRLLGTLEHSPPDQLGIHLAVSPDRKTILFAGLLRHGADLMLIENFR